MTKPDFLIQLPMDACILFQQCVCVIALCVCARAYTPPLVAMKNNWLRLSKDARYTICIFSIGRSTIDTKLSTIITFRIHPIGHRRCYCCCACYWCPYSAVTHYVCTRCCIINYGFCDFQSNGF